MPAQRKSGYKLTQEDYAQVYHCHVNTVTRWQKRNLPLDNPEALVTALLMQHKYPLSVIEKGMDAIKSDYRILASG